MARRPDPRQRFLAQFQLPSGRWKTDSAWSTRFDAASYVWLVIDTVPSVHIGRVFDSQERRPIRTITRSRTTR